MNHLIVFSDLPWYWDKLISLAFGITQALVIALLTFVIVNNAVAKRQKIGTSLNKEGVQRVKGDNGNLTKSDENIFFGKNGNPIPTEIKLCYLSGYAQTLITL